MDNEDNTVGRVRTGIVQAAKKGADQNRPAWKNNQQKQTGGKDNEDRADEKAKTNTRLIKIKLYKDYRDVAKAGDDWETDREKADELVRLGRAEYVK